MRQRFRSFRVFAVAVLLSPIAVQAAIPTAFLDYVDEASPAYTRFKGWVDAVVFQGQQRYAFSATDAAYMALRDGNPAYCAHAIGMVDADVTAAEAVIAGGGRPEISGDSYLEVGPYIRDLALTYDWCAAQTTPSQRTRWAAYAEQAIWNVWNHTQARWGANQHPWSGWSVNDPGNNYYYSFIEATMYWALASDSTTWRQFLDNTKLPPLVAFFDVLDGGGSREGTGYGLAHQRLFELYRLWRIATTTDLAAQNTHARDTIDFWLHATVPTFDRYAPIGDLARESYPNLFDYHRNLVLQARALTTDLAFRERASWWLSRISVPQMGQGFNYRHDLLPSGGAGVAPTARHYHATGTGNLFARSGWHPTAYWLHFIAGPYDQSHAHQEQGAFTLFARDFLAVSENIFSRSGIQQGIETHNVLRFLTAAGQTIPQRASTTSTMTVTLEPGGAIVANANLTPAFGNGTAVSSWQRALRFEGETLRVHDTYATTAGASAVFQINTPVAPLVSGQNARAGNLLVRVLSPANATLSVIDWTTVNAAEYTRGYKLEIRGGTGEYIVELIDDAPLFANGYE